MVKPSRATLPASCADFLYPSLKYRPDSGTSSRMSRPFPHQEYGMRSAVCNLGGRNALIFLPRGGSGIAHMRTWYGSGARGCGENFQVPLTLTVPQIYKGGNILTCKRMIFRAIKSSSALAIRDRVIGCFQESTLTFSVSHFRPPCRL